MEPIEKNIEALILMMHEITEIGLQDGPPPEDALVAAKKALRAARHVIQAGYMEYPEFLPTVGTLARAFELDTKEHLGIEITLYFKLDDGTIVSEDEVEAAIDNDKESFN